MKFSLTLITAVAASMASASALPNHGGDTTTAHLAQCDDASIAHDLALKAAIAHADAPSDVANKTESAGEKEKRQSWPLSVGTTVASTPCYGAPNLFCPVLITFSPGTQVYIPCKTNTGFYQIGGFFYTRWWNINPGFYTNIIC